MTSGIEIVDKIADDVVPVDGNGTTKKEDQPVIESVRVLD